MDGNLRLSNKERAELRERFLKKAAAAFERMFGKANQDQLITFTQREDLACLLGEEMTASLLEEHVAKDRCDLRRRGRVVLNARSRASASPSETRNWRNDR